MHASSPRLRRRGEEVTALLGGAKVGSLEEDQAKLVPRVDAGSGEAAPMVEFADSSFQRAIGGASGIRMVPQAREVVVRMCVGGVLRGTICSKPRHGKG